MGRLNGDKYPCRIQAISLNAKRRHRGTFDLSRSTSPTQ